MTHRPRPARIVAGPAAARRAGARPVSTPPLSGQLAVTPTVVGPPATAPLPDSPRPVGAAILGGSLGSAGGAVVGFGVGAALDLGLGICDTDDLSSDESFCVAFPAVVVGAIVGSAVGARFMARRRGATPSLKATLVAATAGIFTGALGSMAMGAIVENGTARWLAFSVGQGALTGLVAALR